MSSDVAGTTGCEWNRMKIGVIETGRPPEDLAAKHGDYPSMFERLIGAAEPSFRFAAYPTVEGVIPESPEECDGWIVTGSRHGVYESLPWMAPLKDFLRRAAAARVPVVGICFGHQILAETFGARVVKSDRGWAVGPHTYVVTDTTDSLAPPNGGFTLNAMHQDQVETLPDGARVIARSDFCPYAGLAYGDHAISIQPHPEFDNAFERTLIELRRGSIIPDDRAEPALAALNGGEAAPDAAAVAQWIAKFLKQAARPR